MSVANHFANKHRLFGGVHASRAVHAVALLLAPLCAIACGDPGASAQGAGANEASTRLMAPAVVIDSLPSPDTTFARGSAASISGTLEPRARAVLRAEVTGPVQRLSVRVGERVANGALLAQFEVPAVRVNLAAAEAQLAANQAQHLQVTRERDRVAQLLAAGGASRAEFEELDARANAAAAAITSADAHRAAAAADVARLIIRAPFAGVVERRSVTQGSVVQAGDEVLTIVDPRALELEGGVAMTHAAQVSEGVRVALRVSGWGDSLWYGRIVRVAPSVDPATRQLRVTVELPNASARIPVGAWAEGTLLFDSLPADPRSTTGSARRTSGVR